MTMTSLYFDNATVLPPHPQVMKMMWNSYEQHWANPSSPHEKAQQLHPTIQHAYRTIMQTLYLPSFSQCVVTSNGAEATTQALQSALRYGFYEHGKNHIAIAKFHDAAAIMACEAHQKDGAAHISYIDADKHGIIQTSSLLKALSPKTCLLAFPLVHPLLGTIQPLDEIAQICRKKAIPLVIDISQAVGTTIADLSLFDECLFTLRGEAIGSPIGTGLLINTSQSIPITPLIYGNEYTNCMRGGALHVGSLVAISEAVRIASEKQTLYCTEVCQKRDMFEDLLYQKIGSLCVSFPFKEIEIRAPHISCVSFHGVKNEALLYYLNKKKLYATIGGGGFQNITDILKGLNYKMEESYSTISFCLSDTLSDSDVKEAVERIDQCYALLRKISLDG